MQQVFKPENGVSLNLTIPRFDVPTDGEVLDRVPDLWLKTRATTLEKDEDSDYWQIGMNPILYVSLIFGTLVVLVVVRKRRRVNEWFQSREI